MTNGKELLSGELLEQVEQVARAQNREPSELVEEAVRKYLKSERLERFVEKAEGRARAKGLREEDVPRLISEVRRENQERGR
jgi:predicted transcriptional regulator